MNNSHHANDASNYDCAKSRGYDFAKVCSTGYGSCNTPNPCNIPRPCNTPNPCNISRVACDLKALYNSYEEVEEQRRRQRLTVAEFSQKMSNKKKENQTSVSVLDHRWSRVQGMADEEKCREEKQKCMLMQIEKRWECKLSGERKKRLEQFQQSSLQIQAVKSETLALTREERREELAVLRQQLVEEELRRKETACIVQRQCAQIEQLMAAVAELSDTMCVTKAVLVKEQQLRKQMEVDHLTMIKQYYSASTVAIDAERRKVAKMESSMLRVLETVCGNADGGLCGEYTTCRPPVATCKPRSCQMEDGGDAAVDSPMMTPPPMA